MVRERVNQEDAASAPLMRMQPRVTLENRQHAVAFTSAVQLKIIAERFLSVLPQKKIERFSMNALTRRGTQVSFDGFSVRIGVASPDNT
jgi:hypothetical protein